MPTKTISILFLFFYFSCADKADAVHNNNKFTAPKASPDNNENPYKTIGNIPLPEGYERQSATSHSFASWLQQVGLKKDKAVFLYNGLLKNNQSAQFAVLNISRGDKNLQQCADAVMRLRAEYLFAEKKYDSILFIDNEGGRYQFQVPFTRTNFDTYLLKVFGMCGSASLAKQLKPVAEPANMKAGDVWIRGGFPGHAVIVMDVAVNAEGKKIYLLAQSYMPAQDIHLLKNPLDENGSPWYEVDDAEEIITPEYVFRRNELKEW